MHRYGAYMHQGSSVRQLLALCPNLVYLAAIVERGSFTSAATTLGMTTSTLSRAIRRLEHDLGIELALPRGRSIELTEAGLFLAHHAQIAIQDVGTGLREALLASSSPVVRIGLLRSLGSHYVPTIAGDYLKQVPSVQFSFHQASGKQLEQMLLDRTIDLALVAPPPSHPKVVTTDLFEQRIEVVVAPESRWARFSEIDLADLADESFILSERGYDSRTVADKLFEAAGVRPNVILETDDMAMAVALAAANVGIAITPPTPEALVDAVRLPLQSPLARRTVAVCHLANAALSQHVREFLRFLVDHPASATSTAP